MGGLTVAPLATRIQTRIDAAAGFCIYSRGFSFTRRSAKKRACAAPLWLNTANQAAKRLFSAAGWSGAAALALADGAEKAGDRLPGLPAVLLAVIGGMYPGLKLFSAQADDRRADGAGAGELDAANCGRPQLAAEMRGGKGLPSRSSWSSFAGRRMAQCRSASSRSSALLFRIASGTWKNRASAVSRGPQPKACASWAKPVRSSALRSRRCGFWSSGPLNPEHAPRLRWLLAMPVETPDAHLPALDTH